jgi:hypothetical protein
MPRLAAIQSVALRRSMAIRSDILAWRANSLERGRGRDGRRDGL